LRLPAGVVRFGGNAADQIIQLVEREIKEETLAS